MANQFCCRATGATVRRMMQRNLPISGPRVKPAPANMPTEPLNRKDADIFLSPTSTRG